MQGLVGSYRGRVSHAGWAVVDHVGVQWATEFIPGLSFNVEQSK